MNATVATADPGDARLLPAEDLVEVLRLLPVVDSVELKATVPHADHPSVLAALGIDPLQAQLRQVAFFDTPELTLNRAGVVLRARRVQDARGDSVVKLRPADPATIPTGEDRPDGYGIEVDVMPGGFVCSSTVKRRLKDSALRPVFAGTAPVASLFTEQQLTVLHTAAADQVSLDDVVLLGPVTLLKVKFRPTVERRLVAELWFYPDGSRILELSTKCAPAEAFEVAQETKAYLRGYGVDLGAPQSTKTAAALRYFAAQVRSDA
jgi:hypothetical protein